MAWVTASELENALGTPNYLALFDDDGDGEANAAIVTQILRAAHADTLRFVTRGFDNAVPATPSDEMWALELDFAVARSLQRGDTFTREKGQELHRTTEATGAAIAAGLQRASATMPNPTPALAEAPRSSGAASAGLVSFSDEGAQGDGEFWRRER